MKNRHRAARALRRVATGAFLAWFIAVSTLATQAAATIAGFVTLDTPSSALADAPSAGEVVGAAAEQAPPEDGAADPLSPPGDDVPPEVEIDLEHEPWNVCALLDIAPPSVELIEFLHASAWPAGVPLDAASPPPRA